MCLQPFEPKINSSGSLSSFGEGVFHNGGPTDPYTYKWVFAQQFEAFSPEISKKTSKYNYCLVADFIQ
jgi:hypothetical protein